MVKPFYSAYNVLYQLATLIFLWLANKDLNSVFIPQSFMVDLRDPNRSFLKVTAQAACRLGILLIEAGALILIISAINQLYLRATENNKKRKLIAGQTFRINGILTLCFIAILLWGHFLAGFW